MIRILMHALMALAVVTGTPAIAQNDDDLMLVVRPDTVYTEVFTTRPVKRLVTSYYLAFYRGGGIGAEEMAHHLLESNAAGMDGPFLPAFSTRMGKNKAQEMYEAYGMQFPYFPHNGAFRKPAIDNGAVYVFAQSYGSGERGRPAVWDPAYMDAANAGVEAYLKEHGNDPWISCILGFDEPFNYAGTARNPGVVDRVNRDIKKQYGVKLQLTAQDTTIATPWFTTDPALLNADPHDAALLRIAFWRWLNDRLHEAGAREYAIVKKYAPHLEYHAFNRNAINIMGPLEQHVPNSIDRVDQAAIWDVTDGFSADPYPTCNLKRDGRERALYHVGFTGKFITDLGAGKPSKIIMQGFKFHDRLPSAANIREWASQAAKARVTHLEWFGDQRYDYPWFYREVMRLCRLWKDMPALDIPARSDVDVLFSQDSRNVANDDLLHSFYSLHVILGETLGTWYTFTGDNQVKKRMQDLNDPKLIIAPQLSYVSKAFAEKLTARVKAGATLLLLDPDALKWDIETGSLASYRKALVGSGEWKTCEATHLRPTKDGKRRFPDVDVLFLLPGKTGVCARKIALPGDAVVLFTYGDGSPAAYSRKVGSGEVIVFGAMPFGDSRLALSETGWTSVLRKLIDERGIARDLPLWNFAFPATGGEVATYPLLPVK